MTARFSSQHYKLVRGHRPRLQPTQFKVSHYRRRANLTAAVRGEHHGGKQVTP